MFLSLLSFLKVAALNKNNAATSVLGNSNLHNTHMDKEKEYFNNLITGLKYTDVEVKEVKMTEKLKDGKFDHYYLEVTLIKKTEKK